MNRLCKKMGFFSLVACWVFVCLGGTSLAAELRMLVWEGYAPAGQVETFKKLVRDKYGVDVSISVQYVSAADEFYRALKNRTADIIAPSHNLPKDPRYKFIRGKLTLAVNLENVPNYKKILPALQRADYCTENGKVYAVPFVYGPYGLAYNSAKVSEPPKSWNILWDPAYAGKYTICGDYFETNIFITALAMGIDRGKIGRYDAIQSDAFVERLSALYKNAKSLWEGVDTVADLQGLPLATSWGFSFPELRKKGENWKMAIPREGTTGWIDNYMISHTLRDKPQLKRIAEEWLNFVLCPDFQVDAVVHGLGSAPVNFTIMDRLTPEEISAFHLDDPTYFQNNLIPWPVLDARSRKGFQLLVKKAIK